jgi:hypothetical protein
MKHRPGSANLLNIRPKRSYQWETEDGEQVVVLVPKFRSRFLAHWLLPRLRSPFFRVKLDAFGSYVWLCCSGDMTVGEIGRSLQSHFGERVEPVYQRLTVFINRLVQERFIHFSEHPDQHSG